MNKHPQFSKFKLKILPGQFKYVLFNSETHFWNACDELRKNPAHEERDWTAFQIIGDMPFGSVQGLIATITSLKSDGWEFLNA